MILAYGEEILMDAGTINDTDDLTIGPSPYSTYSAEKFHAIIRRLYKKITGNDLSDSELQEIMNGTASD
jgi:hypothetical protein